MTLHELLGEHFARLEPAGCPARTEGRDARIAQTVADAGRDRRFGAEHDEIDAALPRARGDGLAVGHR